MLNHAIAKGLRDICRIARSYKFTDLAHIIIISPKNIESFLLYYINSVLALFLDQIHCVLADSQQCGFGR